MKFNTLAVTCILGLFAASCGKEMQQVTTAESSKRDLTQSIMASGKIYPEVEVQILPEVQGEIESIYVEEGDSVKKGQKLVTINPEILQEQVNSIEAQVLGLKAQLENAKANKLQAEVQLKQAEIEFNRNKTLYESKIITDIDFQNINAQYEIAKIGVSQAIQSIKSSEYNLQAQEAALNQGKTNLSRTTIYAPMDGIVTGIFVEEGKVVAGVNQFNATEIMTVAKLDNIEVRINVGENDVLKINVGDKAKIEVDAYLGKQFLGKVSAVSSSASRNGAAALSSDQPSNYEVKVLVDRSSYNALIKELNKFPFLPGMSASVEIETKSTKGALTIPIEAVTVREDLMTEEELENGGLKEFVFVLAENKTAQKRQVTTGIQDQRYIQILDGLTDGETVIRGPYNFIHKELKDGQTVSVKKGNQEEEKESESGIKVEIN